MNAVEAVEQLGTLGRKLQAREVGLQQPVTALRRAIDWEKVLGDPLAALSQVLGAAGEEQVRAKEAAGEPAAPISSLPLAPLRWEEDRPPIGSGVPTARSGSSSGQSGAPSPAGGVRLARRQTSLLGILNANLEDRVYAQADDPGHVAALAGAVRPEDRRGARDTSPAASRDPLARWGAVPGDLGEPTVSSPLVGQDEVRQAGGQAHLRGGLLQDEAESLDGAASITGQVAVSDRPRGTVGQDLAGDGDAGMNVSGYVSLPQYGPESVVRAGGRREPAHSALASSHSDMPVARDGDPVSLLGGLHGQAHPERQAADWNGWQQSADLVPPALDSVWAADDTPGERPLSMAQIEQVLAALDERLELGLLRMYGAAGGLP